MKLKYWCYRCVTCIFSLEAASNKRSNGKQASECLMTELHLFGGVCLSEEGSWDPHPLLSHPKCLALLAYLAAARPKGCHRRDKLLALFWPDSDERRARGSLRKTLFSIRREIGEEGMHGCGCEDVGVNFTEIWCDVVAFREAVDAGDMETALGHYGGDFMDGFHLGEWPVDEWVAGERRKLRAMAARAGWELVGAADDAGASMEAARWAREAAGLTPFDEMAHRRLLATLNRLGDRSGALREHGEFSRRLAEDLELSPAPETLALVDEIRKRGRANGDRPVSGNGHRSVAVLPFVSLTDDPEGRALADGLHREVISRLEGEGRLRVAPRDRVIECGGLPRDLHGVAEEMDVEMVLEGNVRVWNGRVRIALDLLGGRDLGRLWFHTVERRLGDHDSLATDVAREVARGVGGGAQAP